MSGLAGMGLSTMWVAAEKRVRVLDFVPPIPASFPADRFSKRIDLERGALATDIVYTPLKTQFLIEAEDRGAQIVDGLGMLLHQAAPGFERWFGHKPQVDDETRRVVLAT